LPPLRDALIGYADWLGYGHAERADAWIARLEVNRPEIEAFRAARLPECAAYRPWRTSPAAAKGTRRGADDLPRDAARALAEANARRELNAFTWLASAAPSPLGEGRGEGPGLLSGVPIAVKDLMRVAGAPLTGGSCAFERTVPAEDAMAVARLRRAGASIVGLTNLHEFAYGITSDNPNFGRVVNPSAPDRIPGGSSGGSAAAVAAGIVPLAVGTDTAGSIRIPSACCGIVGFKPSYDAVPRDGVLDLAPTLDHVGPMGRSVRACALMFAAMLDLAEEPLWASDGLAGVRVARLRGYFESPIDDEVRRAVDEAAAAMARDGAACRDHEIDGMALAPAIQFNTICPEAAAVHGDRLPARGAEMGEDVRVRIEIGHFLPGHWYVKAQRLRRALVDRIDAAFDDADVLLCATLRAPAPPVGAARVQIGGEPFALHTAVTHLTLPFNLSGLPAVTIPWARSREGVPICVQVVARRGGDWQALAVAERLERAAPWRAKAA
jgi:Asp-tRNA(Asn)/Glu-tRNA(Gln) amidotransferase A subunit family amidase